MQKILFLLALLAPSFLFAQNIYLSKYIYGNFVNDNNHSVEIFNESRLPQRIDGYFLITRYYALQFSPNTVIPAYSSLRLVKTEAQSKEMELSFTRLPDFLVRFPSTKIEGDYVVLLDKERRMIDGLYFSSQGKVRFLPDKAELITHQNEHINFEIPAASYPKWASFSISPDPAMALVRMKGKWLVTSKKKNMFPATEYGELKANYVEGIVGLKWKTLFEDDCYLHYVERANEENKFAIIDTISAHLSPKNNTEYLYYDKTIQNNRKYFYRIKNIDKFRNIVYSNIIEVYTSDISGEFSFFLPEFNSKELVIRFFSKMPQQVKIKILDEQFREVSILFHSQVSANSQNLIKYTEKLPIGKYYLIADTKTRRFYEIFTVERE